jgi:hypothetical protein
MKRVHIHPSLSLDDFMPEEDRAAFFRNIYYPIFNQIREVNTTLSLTMRDIIKLELLDEQVER